MLSPNDQSHLEEIQGRLQHPVSVQTALQKIIEASRLPPQSVLYAVDRLELWIEMSLKPGDELWWYDAQGRSWRQNGVAIVRNEKAVDSYPMTAEFWDPSITITPIT